jgi:hypothetical protein
LLSRNQEADNKIIELHDDHDSEAIMCMLRHLYGMDYGDLGNPSIEPIRETAANLHLSVFMLGDKYDITSLRAAAAELFDETLKEESRKAYVCDPTIYAISKLTIEGERREAMERYPELEDLETRRTVLDKHEQLRLKMVEAHDQGVRIPSAQYPPKKVEKYLKSQLKALAAQVFLPGQDSAKRTKEGTKYVSNAWLFWTVFRPI